MSSYGFHATLGVDIRDNEDIKNSTCSLILALALPRDVILDKHEVSLIPSLRILHINEPASGAISGRSVDSEKPIHALPSAHELEDESVLLLFDHCQACSQGVGAINVPIHMRYPDPRRPSSGYHEVMLKEPNAFWACNGLRDIRSTDSSVSNDYPYLAAAKEHFPATYAITLAQVVSSSPTSIRIPTVSHHSAGLVEWWTLAAVYLAFGYMLSVLWNVLSRQSTLDTKQEDVVKRRKAGK